MFDAIVQMNPKESELLDCFSGLDPSTKIIIQKCQGDRTMLKIIYRLVHWWNNIFLMTPRQLGYYLEKWANDDYIMKVSFQTGNKMNEVQFIQAMVRQLYRQKKLSIVLFGLFDAFRANSSPNTVSLYFTYLYRLCADFPKKLK